TDDQSRSIQERGSGMMVGLAVDGVTDAMLILASRCSHALIVPHRRRAPRRTDSALIISKSLLISHLEEWQNLEPRLLLHCVGTSCRARGGRERMCSRTDRSRNQLTGRRFGPGSHEPYS